MQAEPHLNPNNVIKSVNNAEHNVESIHRSRLESDQAHESNQKQDNRRHSIKP